MILVGFLALEALIAVPVVSLRSTPEVCRGSSTIGSGFFAGQAHERQRVLVHLTVIFLYFRILIKE